MKYDDITQKMIKDRFDYDAKRGKLIWKKPPQKKLIGKVADHVMTNGYHVVYVFGKYIGTNRLVWAWHYGKIPTIRLVNIDGDRNNTSIENLKESTSSDIMIRTGNTSANTTGIKGVSWNIEKNKWRAQIYANRKSRHIGYFVTFDEAVMKRYQAEKEYLNETEMNNSPAFIYLKNKGLLEDANV